MEQQNLKELLAEMSLEEKIGQLFQASGDAFAGGNVVTGPDQDWSITKEQIWLSGSILGVCGASQLKEIQKEYMARHPHHIPLLFMLDIINGYQTVYPVPLAQGAMFEPELSGECAGMAAREGAAGGLHVTFSPMADMVRDARWGRVMESTGEDVYLNGLYAKAMVEGYQGNWDAKESLGACVKHFAGYGAAEAGREYHTAEISDRTLQEWYLPAYEAGIKAGSALVMTSFNTINGIPATVNRELMRAVLRGQMGFDGVLISDYGAIGETAVHGVAADGKDAALRSLKAGVDIDMMSGAYPLYIKELMEEGLLHETLLDECVMRVLELKNRLGLFENPYKGADEQAEAELFLSTEHRALARKAAVRSFVLLKNEGNALPLKPNEKIALCGPYADTVYMSGSWSYTGHPRMEESVTVAEAAKALQGWSFDYQTGCTLMDPGVILEGFADFKTEDWTEDRRLAAHKEAIEAAGKADQTVLFLGEHYLQTGEAASRSALDLPKVQMDLLKDVAAVNSNVVTVVFCGRPLDLRLVSELSRAVLVVWMPGMEGGRAIMDVLTGKENPSGRLPMSFPYCVGQVPVHYDVFRTGRPFVKEKKERYVSRYQDIPNEPLYPFGYGLSYTSFTISEVYLDKKILKEGGMLHASVTVKNTGDREGTEVVQLYLHDEAASTARPVKQLKGFRKVCLKPGEETEVSFTVTDEMLKLYTDHNTFDYETGYFTVMIGNSSLVKDGGRFLFERGDNTLYGCVRTGLRQV